MLKDLKPRLYQQTIMGTCQQKNCLVVLPTGMGKTVIALMMAIQRLKQFPNSKILFLAPTRPLAEQHIETFKKHSSIEKEKMVLFTGHVKPEKRAKLWKEAKVIFSTPQGMENDVLTRKIDLKEASLIVFDEAHRAVGEYAYVFLAKEYQKKAKHPRILALTASPGADLEKITEVTNNLYIEDVELKTEEDPDVKPYVQPMELEWKKVELPEEFKKVQKYLKKCYESKLNQAVKYGYVDKRRIGRGKIEILKMQGYLHGEISRGDRSMEILRSVSLLAEAMKAEHAIELLETQGITQLMSYFEKIYSEAGSTRVKAVKNLALDMDFKTAFLFAKRLSEEGIEHPKMPEVRKLVKKETGRNKQVKIILFTQYRESAKKIQQVLEEEGIRAKVFVGQQKKNGMGLSQKKQKEMLDQFKQGEFNVLIATSVAEEGIDIPKVDMVLFYEPVPSGIRTIQRRGRTGRQEKGRVIIMTAKGTRDEGYRWSAHRKEKRMRKELKGLKKKLNLAEPKKTENTLKKYMAPELDLKIFADFREKASQVIRELHEMGIGIELSSLDCGDYILSPRVGIEFKKIQDFVDSIIDGRLLNQIKELRDNYERPMVIVEGEEDIYSQRSIHPNAIRGMLATIMISYGMPVFQTKDHKETAALLAVIAKREQEESGTEFSPHASRKPTGLKQQQEYLVSALPGVGMTLARPLLEKFGSVRKIVNASSEELKEVEKIGEKKAEEIKKVFEEEYRQ